MTEAIGKPSIAKPVKSRAILWLRRILVTYTIFAVIIYALLRIGIDRWAWATLVGYGPRWIFVVPAGVIFVAYLCCRRLPWKAAALIAAICYFIVNFNIPYAALIRGRTSQSVDGPSALCVLTINANGIGTDGKMADPEKLRQLIAVEQPDVVAMQEWTRERPLKFLPSSWHVRHYNDLVVASRFPITSAVALGGDALGGEDCLMGGRLQLSAARSIWMFVAHLETPRRGIDPFTKFESDAWNRMHQSIARRRTVSTNASNWIRRTAGDSDVIIAGDFNMVADGAIYRDCWSGWTNAFGATGWGFGGTKLQNRWRVRIDQILTSANLRPSRCTVGPDVESDHLPLIARLEWRPKG